MEKEEKRAREIKEKVEKRAAKLAEKQEAKWNMETKKDPNPREEQTADASLASKVQLLTAQFENSISEERVKMKGKRQAKENSWSQRNEKESKKQNLEDAAEKLQIPKPPTPAQHSNQTKTD